MKRIVVALVIIGLILTSCATLVRIDTNAPNAKVSVNGELIGKNPAQKSLSDAVFNEYNVTIQADGYNEFKGQLKKEVKMPALIGGVFLWPFLIWCYGPVDTQYFELQPM